MHPELTLLLELQDLRAQQRSLHEDSGESVGMEEKHFNLDRSRAVELLEEKIEGLKESLTPAYRARYERIAPQRDRVVVPVIHGTCYGCFVSIPTATAGEQIGNSQVQTCENCGCFLYIVD